MYESRKSIRVLVSVLLFGLAVGMAHAATGSIEEVNLDPRNQPLTESLLAGLDSDSSVTADAESADPAVEPGCASDTGLTAALGIETALSASVAPSGWTCGSCSVSACANRPVGTPCGFGRYCVVSTVCTAQPVSERCVCGTDHF